MKLFSPANFYYEDETFSEQNILEG